MEDRFDWLKRRLGLSPDTDDATLLTRLEAELRLLGDEAPSELVFAHAALLDKLGSQTTPTEFSKAEHAAIQAIGRRFSKTRQRLIRAELRNLIRAFGMAIFFAGVFVLMVQLAIEANKSFELRLPKINYRSLKVLNWQRRLEFERMLRQIYNKLAQLQTAEGTPKGTYTFEDFLFDWLSGKLKLKFHVFSAQDVYRVLKLSRRQLYPLTSRGNLAAGFGTHGKKEDFVENGSWRIPRIPRACAEFINTCPNESTLSSGGERDWLFRLVSSFYPKYEQLGDCNGLARFIEKLKSRITFKRRELFILGRMYRSLANCYIDSKEYERAFDAALESMCAYYLEGAPFGVLDWEIGIAYYLLTKAAYFSHKLNQMQLANECLARLGDYFAQINLSMVYTPPFLYFAAAGAAIDFSDDPNLALRLVNKGLKFLKRYEHSRRMRSNASQVSEAQIELDLQSLKFYILVATVAPYSQLKALKKKILASRNLTIVKQFSIELYEGIYFLFKCQPQKALPSLERAYKLYVEMPEMIWRGNTELALERRARTIDCTEFTDEILKALNLLQEPKTSENVKWFAQFIRKLKQ